MPHPNANVRVHLTMEQAALLGGWLRERRPSIERSAILSALDDAIDVAIELDDNPPSDEPEDRAA